MQVDDPAVTVKLYMGDVTPPMLAVILLVPAVTPAAKPPEPIVAIFVEAESQVTCDVMFCMSPLLYVPVAVNCCVAPAVTEGFDGVMAMELSVTPAGENTRSMA